MHVLARSYHWSEHDVLALSLERRRTYLALVDEESDAALFEHAGPMTGEGMA